MSFTTKQVRAQLAAMGYHNVPDAAVALFATKLTEKAKLRPQSEQKEEAGERADHPSHLSDSVTANSDDESCDGQHARHLDSPAARHARSSSHLAYKAGRPPLPPSNRHLLMRRTRPRSPLTSSPSATTSPSPRQPLRTVPARSPSTYNTQQASRTEERREEEDDYTEVAAATECVSRSDKENVATPINIQRGLAKVLAERGIASPFKPTTPTGAPDQPAAPLSAAELVGGALHSSSRSSASRPSSPLSSSFASSQSSSSFPSMSSFDRTAPLAGARALQLREEERVRGVTRGYGQGGFKKADVVNRYQQYREEWDQSNFLHRRQHGR